jgi:NADPH:quinone reductase-like Zn-dependent oxidoreductase
MVMNKEHYSGLERLATHAVDGTVASFMDRPYDLSSTADAVRHLVAGNVRGKVVITV